MPPAVRCSSASPTAGTATTSNPPAVASAPAISFEVSEWSSTRRIVASMAVGSPEFADDVAQGADPRGLCAVPGCSRGAGRRVVARPRGLRQDEEGDRTQVAVFHYATQDGRRVEIGEVEVEQHE